MGEIIWVNNSLSHHGIKGQKWGVRRFENEDGTLTRAGKRRYKYVDKEGKLTEKGQKKYGSQDHYDARMLAKKGARNLSNDELRKIAERNNLEKSIKKGDAETKRILLEHGLKTARTVAISGAAILGGKYLIKKLPDISAKIARAATQATVNATKEVAKGGVDLVKSAASTVNEAGHNVRKAAATSKTGRSYVKFVDSIVGKKRRR